MKIEYLYQSSALFVEWRVKESEWEEMENVQLDHSIKKYSELN